VSPRDRRGKPIVSVYEVRVAGGQYSGQLTTYGGVWAGRVEGPNRALVETGHPGRHTAQVMNTDSVIKCRANGEGRNFDVVAGILKPEGQRLHVKL
jgi:hypothetical protein